MAFGQLNSICAGQTSFRNIKWKDYYFKERKRESALMAQANRCREDWLQGLCFLPDGNFGKTEIFPVCALGRFPAEMLNGKIII